MSTPYLYNKTSFSLVVAFSILSFEAGMQMSEKRMIHLPNCRYIMKLNKSLRAYVSFKGFSLYNYADLIIGVRNVLLHCVSILKLWYLFRSLSCNSILCSIPSFHSKYLRLVYYKGKCQWFSTYCKR